MYLRSQIPSADGSYSYVLITSPVMTEKQGTMGEFTDSDLYLPLRKASGLFCSAQDVGSHAVKSCHLIQSRLGYITHFC